MGAMSASLAGIILAAINDTKGGVWLAAVMHGAGNAWIGGYIDVYRGPLRGSRLVHGVSVVVSAIVVLIAEPTSLSRTAKRDVLEVEDRNG